MSEGLCQSAPLVTASSVIGQVCAVVHQTLWRCSQETKGNPICPLSHMPARVLVQPHNDLEQETH